MGRTNQKPGSPQGGAGGDPAESQETGPAWGRTPGSTGLRALPRRQEERPAAASLLHIAVLRQTHWNLPPGRPPHLCLPKSGGRAQLTTSSEARAQGTAARLSHKGPGGLAGTQAESVSRPPSILSGAEPTLHPAGRASPGVSPTAPAHSHSTRTDAHADPLKPTRVPLRAPGVGADPLIDDGHTAVLVEFQLFPRGLEPHHLG